MLSKGYLTLLYYVVIWTLMLWLTLIVPDFRLALSKTDAHIIIINQGQLDLGDEWKSQRSLGLSSLYSLLFVQEQPLRA